MEILFRPEIGVPAVFLTRSPEVAAYWALLKRDNDEGRGSIFVFDRQSLTSRYKIQCNPEVYWHSDRTFHDEAEEQIFDDVTKIGDHLIGIVSGPTVKLAQRDKILKSRMGNDDGSSIAAARMTCPRDFGPRIT
jgi:hypothetical protein